MNEFPRSFCTNYNEYNFDTKESPFKDTLNHLICLDDKKSVNRIHGFCI